MDNWTEVKCYICSRVCGEIPGAGERLDSPEILGRLRPGHHCTVVGSEVRCSRCGGPVYPGETFTIYLPYVSDPTGVRRRSSPQARREVSRAA